jgi:hypothetical protein
VKIEDPYEAAKSQYPETPENVPGELALNIAGKVIPVIGIFNAVRDYYSRAAVTERMHVLIDAVNSKVNAVDTKFESPELAESLRIAMEETWRTTDVEKVKRFGLIVGGSLAANNPDALREASDFIRTLAQLDERDMRVLNLLYSSCAHLLNSYTNLHDPNPFIDVWTDVIARTEEANLAADDFYASCKRLEGFGLAIELPRNPSRINPGQYSFRVTRRGENLVKLLAGSHAP